MISSKNENFINSQKRYYPKKRDKCFLGDTCLEDCNECEISYRQLRGRK
jgi:hypothetical protein